MELTRGYTLVHLGRTIRPPLELVKQRGDALRPSRSKNTYAEVAGGAEGAG